MESIMIAVACCFLIGASFLMYGRYRQIKRAMVLEEAQKLRWLAKLQATGVGVRALYYALAYEARRHPQARKDPRFQEAKLSWKQAHRLSVDAHRNRHVLFAEELEKVVNNCEELLEVVSQRLREVETAAPSPVL